jgi:hypothetical protein
VLQNGLTFGYTYSIWRDGQLKPLAGAYLTLAGMNNRGLIIFMTTTDLYNNYLIKASPFVPDTASPHRFTGGYCSGGRYSSFVAVNDSNDVLASAEFMPNGAQPVWRAGGCKNLSSVYPATWNVLGEGPLVAGVITRGGFPVAVLTDGVTYASLDELLDAPSLAAWHVLSVVGIAADRSIVARAIRLSDNTTITVKLTRLTP